VPQIEVTFDIDANGILHVSAKDKATGKEQKIRIEASSGLTDAEIKRMKDEAEANAESDKQAKEQVEKLNAADALIFSTEKQLKEFGDKLPADKKAPIEEGLTKLKAAYESKNLADIEVAQNELNTAWTAASEEMYKASAEAGAQPGADAGAGAPQGDNSDTVTDVDYEEVKDEKK
jgi:molecular chaperone DnaK